jgi:hypothetical protein
MLEDAPPRVAWIHCAGFQAFTQPTGMLYSCHWRTDAAAAHTFLRLDANDALSAKSLLHSQLPAWKILQQHRRLPPFVPNQHVSRMD